MGTNERSISINLKNITMAIGKKPDGKLARNENGDCADPCD